LSKAKHWLWKNKLEKRNLQEKLSCKSESEETRGWRPSRSWLSESRVHLESEESSEAEVKNLKLIIMDIWRQKYVEGIEY